MREIEWRDAATVVAPFTDEILKHFPGSLAKQHYFSMVFPGHRIAGHRDEQEVTWICRIHVPIMTNTKAVITIDDAPFHLAVGTAYKVNTLMKHTVFNGGACPRLHWMFDVHAQAARL